MRDVVIVAARRTPIGRHRGVLKDVRPDDLAALVLKTVMEDIHGDPALVDDVILGAANQAGEDNRNVARMALLLAGFPVSVPGATVNRLCGSSLEAVNRAYQAIRRRGCGYHYRRRGGIDDPGAFRVAQILHRFSQRESTTF